ncbi:MAG TPA: thiamine pyrophosphate-binding protein [Pirellulales bacterium]|jgi:indolepyruvate decarboxylase|nr:thiamine pyrophosphate-binding protein [Pirellulales bacterium]
MDDTKTIQPRGAGQRVVGLSIGEYLIRRLQDFGIRDVFGIPGDYILGFYSMLERSPVNVVGCCREDNAGFAADAYARVNGIGAVCVTYGVGGLSLCNSIAGAYAEKSPVVVISGAPGIRERHKNPLLHHKVREFRTQLDVFEKICVATAELNDPTIAFRDIDRVITACLRSKRPVYIELPRDMVKVVPEVPHEFRSSDPTSDPEALAEAVAEAARLIDACRLPAILAGVEIHRYGLQDELLNFAEATRIPIACTVMGKSVVRETHPLFAGLYEGAMSRAEVTQFVEESDCVVMLGTFMTDIDLGIYTANLDPARCIYAASDDLRIRHHHYQDVLLGDFIRALTARRPHPPERVVPQRPEQNGQKFQLQPDRPITITRLIQRLNESLDDRTIVISDIGDALFASIELTTHGRTEFIGPAYYTSMGFGVPGALGAATARPDVRTVVVVGDGAFQMTGNELSTIVRQGHHSVVIVLDNKGYGTERILHPGDFKYNEVHPWSYHKLPEVLGGGKGYCVRTEGEFDRALSQAWHDKQMHLIQAHLPLDDSSPSLRRLAEHLRKRV